jgi:hypothetical protein
LAAQATVESSASIVVSDSFQVAYGYDGVQYLGVVYDSTGYRVDLMSDRFPFLMSPLLDDSAFAHGPSQPKVSASRFTNLFTVEPWLAFFNCGCEFPYSHVYGKHTSVSSFQSCIFLDGYVHIPVVAVTDQFRFPQFKFHERFLVHWKLDWKPSTHGMKW